jgi:tetratricopeptide (TPR) repeat protein
MYTEAGRTASLALNETTLPKLKALPLGGYVRIIGMSNLASSYLQAGRLDEAIALLQSTIPACEAKLGAADYVTLFDRGQLALAYESLHRRTEAEALWRESLARRRASEKPDRGGGGSRHARGIARASGRKPKASFANRCRCTRRRPPTTGSATRR